MSYRTSEVSAYFLDNDFWMLSCLFNKRSMDANSTFAHQVLHSRLLASKAKRLRCDCTSPILSYRVCNLSSNHGNDICSGLYIMDRFCNQNKIQNYMKKRRTFTNEQKSKIALEVIRETSTIAELSQKYQVNLERN